MIEHQHYRGRFAPSPTGPLHLGSALAACASWLDARAHGGQWLIRMEDLDPPREQPGADRLILDLLKSIGWQSDEDVVYQSARHSAYEEALHALLAAGHAFECRCSRSDLAATNGLHRGACRAPSANAERAPSVRLRVPDCTVEFDDRIQGRYRQNLLQEVGDFVLRRADGPYAYQLAVVVDDAAQQISDIVRGADLLDSTPRQIYLQRCLGLPTPRYAHLPLLLGADGQKLSKQNLAPALSPQGFRQQLPQIAAWLGQPVPDGPIELDGLIRHWHIDRVPRQLAPLPDRDDL
jgi:glutamyl-Q tRNA(Asp) synthetase